MINTRMLQQGFTVIEVVIAFAILSIVTVITVSVVTQNTMRTHHIETRLMALEVAESALAEVNGKIIFEKPGAGFEYQSNTNNGFKWKATVNAYRQEARSGESNTLLPLWKVNLLVFDKTEKQAVFQISTLVPGK